MKSRKQIIESEFYIIDKQNRKVPFIQNGIQDKLDEIREKLKTEGKPIWILILKARKEGVSAKVIADWTVDCVNPKLGNINAVVISHQQEATKRLFKRAKYYIQSCKDPIITKTDNANEISFPETNSTFYIGTAGARAFGRGDDIHRCHLSEFAFYDEKFDVDGLLQAIPEGGEVIGETTANGIGNRFYKEWQRAKNGDSKFYPLFLSWADNPDYRIKDPLIEHDTDLTEEELLLKQRYGLDYEQLAWRREKIKEFTNVELFKQEYPICDREAFLHTGSPAFNTNALEAYVARNPTMGDLIEKDGKVEFVPNPKGWWRIWEQPKYATTYFMDCDTAEGEDKEEIGDTDYTEVELIDADMRQVAELKRRINPDVTALELSKAGRYFNIAFAGVERNGGSGLATLNQFKNMYPDSHIYKTEVFDEISRKITNKIGWLTNERTRPLLVTDLAASIADHSLIINSDGLLDECFSFIRNNQGKYEAQQGSHDDGVIAMGIAIQVRKSQPETRRLYEGQFVKKKEKKSGKRSYANRDDE